MPTILVCATVVLGLEYIVVDHYTIKMQPLFFYNPFKLFLEKDSFSLFLDENSNRLYNSSAHSWVKQSSDASKSQTQPVTVISSSIE